MASRAMVKCDEDLPVVDADRGKHARALRVQRSCARVRVACSGVRTTYVRVHLCWDLSCSRARAAARAKFATEGRNTGKPVRRDTLYRPCSASTLHFHGPPAGSLYQ